MTTPLRLAIVAAAAVMGIGAVSMAFEPKPAETHTAATPVYGDQWEFVIYEEDGSISVMDYDLSLWDCMERIEKSHAQSKACERQVVSGIR